MTTMEQRSTAVTAPGATREPIGREPLGAKRAVAGGGLIAAGVGVGAVVTGEGASRTGELGLDVALSHDRLTPLVDVAQGINVGLGPVVGPLAVLLVAAILFVRHRRAAVVFAGSALGLWLASSVFKVVFARHRPPSAQVHALITETGANSFPSGHTALAVAVVCGTFFAARVLGRPGGRVLLIGLPLAVVVAASRLYLGAHYLGDVIGSFLFVGGMALLAAGLAPVLMRRVGARR